MTQKNKDNILIAKVLKVFGIRGQVKLLVYSHQPQNIENYQLFDQNQEKVTVKFTNKNKTPVKFSNSNAIMIATVNDVKNRNDAELQKDLEIFVKKQDLLELENDEYYYHDLKGLDVINNENQEKIGVVTNVLDYGAGTIICVNFNKKPQKKLYQEEELFPFKNEFFPKVDIKNNKIFINLIDFVKID